MVDDFDLDLLVARLGNLYTKHRLSPPFALREAARHWLGISTEDIVATVEKHFRDYRHLYSGRAVFRRAAGSHQEAVARQAPGSRS